MLLVNSTVIFLWVYNWKLKESDVNLFFFFFEADKHLNTSLCSLLRTLLMFAHYRCKKIEDIYPPGLWCRSLAIRYWLYRYNFATFKLKEYFANLWVKIKQKLWTTHGNKKLQFFFSKKQQQQKNANIFVNNKNLYSFKF